MIISSPGTRVRSQKTRIMVVDDDLTTHTLLKKMLVLSGSDVAVFPSGSIAILGARNYNPDLILLDTESQEMDGFQVCQEIKRIGALVDVPVIFLSAFNEMDYKIRAFEAGAADYITKPFHFAELRARMAVHLRLQMLERQMAQQYEMDQVLKDLLAAQQATNFALAKLAEYRDEETGTHLERVRDYCRVLSIQLHNHSDYSHLIDEEFIDCIQHASLLHDIGKVAIPDSILFKAGKLTADEFAVMKTHTLIGAENLQAIYNRYSNTMIGMSIEIALYHHERWDGAGYPDGLHGKNIPLSARIMALADFYDALRSDRCYRNGHSHQQVKEMIMDGDGTHFDSVIVQAFLACEEEFARIVECYEAGSESVFSCESNLLPSGMVFR